MIYSQMDVIGIERWVIENRKRKQGFLKRAANSIMSKENPCYSFDFYVIEDIYIRGLSIANRISDRLDIEFDIEDLADALYADFLQFVDRSYDIPTIYKQLQSGGLSPASRYRYTDNEIRNGVYFGDVLGYEITTTNLMHKDALRGELLLEDMNEFYPNHGYTLEGILETVFYNFVDGCRKGNIDRPIDRIIQYIVY